MSVNEIPDRQNLARSPQKLLQTVAILWDSALGSTDGDSGPATNMPHIPHGTAADAQQACDGYGSEVG